YEMIWRLEFRRVLFRSLDLLESKVPCAGGVLVKVNRFFPSSQLCHQCGSRRADLTLSDRIYVCGNPECGFTGDRDLNASRNILRSEERRVGKEYRYLSR